MNRDKGGFRVPRGAKPDVFPKVVFMRKRVIKIYQVPMNLLNGFSVSSLLFSLFLTAAATLWTGYKAAWDHPAVLVVAAMMSFFTFVFFVAATCMYFVMRSGTEPVPYPLDQEGD